MNVASPRSHQREPDGKKPYTGGCQCGKTRFVASAAPRFVANCHCAACRKATGAAISTWVGVLNDTIDWKGERAFFASSPGVKRGFCQSCGTPLTYEGTRWPGETHFLVGVFDDPSQFTPTVDVYTEEKLAWSQLVENESRIK